MIYDYDKIKNPRILRILFKTSVTSVLLCFLALFVGNLSGTKVVNVRDDEGLEKPMMLTGDQKKNFEILKNDKDIKLKEEDTFSVSDSGFDQTCFIERGKPVNLQMGEVKSKFVAKSGSTVEDALKNVGLELGENDGIKIEKSGVEGKPEKEGGLDRKTKVEKDMKITVDKVDITTSFETHDVGYDVERVKDGNLEEGVEKVKVEGKPGKVKIETQQRIVNGEVVETKQIGEGTMLEMPVNKVIVVGTKPKKNSPIESPAEERKIRRRSKLGANGARSGVVEGFATCYSIGSRTSCGTKPRWGTIAGDPGVIPYGASCNVFDARTGKLIYSGVMCDYCPTAVKRRRGVVVDLYGANVGRLKVKVEWHL